MIENAILVSGENYSRFFRKRLNTNYRPSVHSCRESKKYIRQIYYGRSGEYPVYACIKELKTGITVSEMGDRFAEPIGYIMSVSMSLPINMNIEKQTVDSSFMMVWEYQCDYFTWHSITHNIEFEDFIIADLDGNLCRVLSVEKMYGKQYVRG